MKPKKIILLNGNEYLSNIVHDLEKMRDLFGINFVDYRKDNFTYN